MSKYIIQGGQPLNGVIEIGGNKNAVLPIMAATLLISDDVKLTNVPQIRDVSVMGTILESLGATVSGIGTNELVINTANVSHGTIAPELAQKLRASVLLLGPLYARFGDVTLPHPGGDVIGKRSIQTHLDGLELMGAKITSDHSSYRVVRNSHPNSDIDVFMDEPSVTGTENLIMAAVLGNVTIKLSNVAYEPHINDLIDFIENAGGNIAGKGTNILTIQGVKKLGSIEHVISPDYIEAGTYAVLGAISRGKLDIRNVNPNDLRLPLLIMKRMGVDLTIVENRIVVKHSQSKGYFSKIQTAPHPGFPTDLMSPFIVLGSQAEGETLYHDPMYESRMFFVDKLISMGARITICDPHRVIVYGPSQLVARRVDSPDIRAGMAMVIAALVAEGESTIQNAQVIERGYEHLITRLQSLGAHIHQE